MPKRIAYIGLGSNLNNPLLQLHKAIRRLSNSRSVSLDQCSSFYRTAPLGYDAQPYFINAVIRITTSRSPMLLLKLLLSIESAHQRVRTTNQNAPRTLDLDLLLYGRLICSTADLILPHPRMHQRRFVLEPMLEISPDAFIPGKGYAARYRSATAGQQIEKVGPLLLNQ